MLQSGSGVMAAGCAPCPELLCTYVCCLGCARLQAGRQLCTTQSTTKALAKALLALSLNSSSFSSPRSADFFSVILARKLAAGLTRTHLSALLGCRNPIPDMVRPEAL